MMCLMCHLHRNYYTVTQIILPTTYGTWLKMAHISAFHGRIQYAVYFKPHFWYCTTDVHFFLPFNVSTFCNSLYSSFHCYWQSTRNSQETIYAHTQGDVIDRSRWHISYNAEGKNSQCQATPWMYSVLFFIKSVRCNDSSQPRLFGCSEM